MEELNFKEIKNVGLDYIIEELLYYATINLDLDELDLVFTRNVLLHEFNVSEPYQGEIDKDYIKSLETITPIYNQILDINPDFDDFEMEKIMSILSPKPSEITKKFNELLTESPEKATSYFYKLMVKNNYIRLDDIRRNLLWYFEGENNTLEITVNLSKPEKNNKDIMKLKTMVSTSYPKCRLCLENVGYYGGGTYPARSNIRVVPIKLNDEDWFFQYSPYAYYNEHSIIINNLHTPMNISLRTIKMELDFVDMLPNYFIGSNSDLPIVGGSLLNHEHFQGGEHIMPMMKAKTRYSLSRIGVKDVEIEYLDWYNSCFLLKSTNRSSLLDVCDLIIQNYYKYSDSSIDLIASDEGGRHNAITSITRKVDNVYYAYMILRNNRCNDTYPDGIFHAHKQYHNIKSEGIGLIEAMGLFILPGRLKTEMDLIANIMSSSYESISDVIERNSVLEKHLEFINKLITKYGRHNTKESAIEIIHLEIGKVCERILKNTGVFKDSLDGQIALFKFFKELSFEVKE